eukprot:SAG31_NODE_20120_length_583_cov_0.960744_1_plen_146_part_00
MLPFWTRTGAFLGFMQALVHFAECSPGTDDMDDVMAVSADVADKNNDGLISPFELTVVLTRAGKCGVPKIMIDKTFVICDVDQNGQLSTENFVSDICQKRLDFVFQLHPCPTEVESWSLFITIVTASLSIAFSLIGMAYSRLQHK